MNLHLKCTQKSESTLKMQYSRFVNDCLLHELNEATPKTDTEKIFSLPKPT